MPTATVTLGQLIDWTFEQIEMPEERAVSIVLPVALPASSTVTTTLPGLDLHPSDLCECGQTLYLVTNRSDDATPVYTLTAGYFNSPLVAHEAGELFTKNPNWSRVKVKSAILRSLGALSSTIPLIVSETYTRVAGKRLVELPANTLSVHTVQHYNEITGAIYEEGGCEIRRDLPTSVVATGCALLIPPGIEDGDELIITRRRPWAFASSDPAESDELTVPAGAEDLPSMWAAAFMVAGRELSKAETTSIEKALNDYKQRTGSPDRIARQLWQDFYRRVDEARRLVDVPRRLKYVKFPRSSSWSW